MERRIFGLSGIENVLDGGVRLSGSQVRRDYAGEPALAQIPCEMLISCGPITEQTAPEGDVLCQRKRADLE
jgi:hypothetical protein